MCTLPSRFIKERNQVSNASAYCREHRLIPNNGWLWRGSVWKQTRLEKKAEAEHKWRNHKESRRRWCRAATCQTTATYGKPPSPWNWKTKVPASDKHYWLARSPNSSSSGDFSLFLDIFVFSCQIPKLKLSTFSFHTSSTRYQSVRRTTSACVYSYTISYARLLSTKVFRLLDQDPFKKLAHAWKYGLLKHALYLKSKPEYCVFIMKLMLCVLTGRTPTCKWWRTYCTLSRQCAFAKILNWSWSSNLVNLYLVRVTMIVTEW